MTGPGMMGGAPFPGGDPEDILGTLAPNVPAGMQMGGAGPPGGGPGAGAAGAAGAMPTWNTTSPGAGFASIAPDPAFVAANSGAGGFFNLADREKSFIAPPQQMPGVSTMRGQRPMHQQTFGMRFGAGQPAEHYLPSTDNYKLLPQGYQDPNMIMRNGEIINKRILDDPQSWRTWASGGDTGANFIGGFYPINLSHAYSGHGHSQGGWPGSIAGLHYNNTTQWV